MKLLDWLVPDSALRWQRLTREVTPWYVRYHGGRLDGREMVHLGAGVATVLPIARLDGSFLNERYRHEFPGAGVIDAYCEEA